MSQKFTRSDWLAYEARRSKIAVNSDGVKDEDKLHAQIIEHCDREMWLYFHGSMAHKTYRTKGENDFHILADGGRSFYIECKTKHGKLSTDQLAVIALAKHNGHIIHVVTSYEQFLQIVK